MSVVEVFYHFNFHLLNITLFNLVAVKYLASIVFGSIGVGLYETNLYLVIDLGRKHCFLED